MLDHRHCRLRNIPAKRIAHSKLTAVDPAIVERLQNVLGCVEVDEFRGGVRGPPQMVARRLLIEAPAPAWIPIRRISSFGCTIGSVQVGAVQNPWTAPQRRAVSAWMAATARECG
jgi:hypothetical protein